LEEQKAELFFVLRSRMLISAAEGRESRRASLAAEIVLTFVERA
jgi:hypothetical protein